MTEDSGMFGQSPPIDYGAVAGSVLGGIFTAYANSQGNRLGINTSAGTSPPIVQQTAANPPRNGATVLQPTDTAGIRGALYKFATSTAGIVLAVVAVVGLVGYLLLKK